MRTRLLFQRIVVWGSLLTALAICLPGQENKLSPDLQQVPDSAAVDVIIQYRSAPTASRLQRLQRFSRSAPIKSLSAIQGAAARVTSRQLHDLAADSDVEYITPDREVRSTMMIDVARGTIGAAAAQNSYGYTGKGVTVAVVDSGIAQHADLNGPTGRKVVFEQSFVPGVYRADDEYGHGTHIAGIIAGTGALSSGANNTRQFKGIAPDARLVSFRILDKDGRGRDSDVVNAINQAITYKNVFNIRVINLSLGRPVYEDYRGTRSASRCGAPGKRAFSWLSPQATRGATTASTIAATPPSTRPLIARTWSRSAR